MTDLERLALDTLLEVRDHFNGGRISRLAFTDVMGHVRDAIARLENRKFGCPTGTHSAKCTCKPPTLGTSA